MREYLPRLSLFGLFSTQAIESNYGMEDCATQFQLRQAGTLLVIPQTTILQSMRQLLVMLRTMKYNTQEKCVWYKNIYLKIRSDT